MSSITFRISYSIEITEAAVIALIKERHDLNEKQLEYLLAELRQDQDKDGIDLSWEVDADTLNDHVTEAAEEYINEQVSIIPDELANKEEEESENEDKEKNE